MGYEEITGADSIIINDFSAGWFAGKQNNDIPGSLKSKEPIGMYSGNAVIWYRGALRSMFGYDNVNTTALNSGAVITGLFASDVLDDMLCVATDKIYKSADTNTPVDVTGTTVLTTTDQIHFAEWQYETTSYLIGVNGVDHPFKWDGTTCADLGTLPPHARWAIIFNQALWLARTSTETSTIFFSNLADPETFTTNYNYKFNAPITGVGVLGDKLVVFKDYSIGILTGENNITLTHIDNYIDGVGCSGGFTIVNAKLKGTSVLVFHSHNGWYAFDGSQTLIPLSNCIIEKYRTSAAVDKFNQARFKYATATYLDKYGWVVGCLSDVGDTTNNFMVIIDLNRVYETREGIYSPHWPVDAIPANIFCVSKNVTAEHNQLFFGDYSGFINKFDETVFNHNGVVYTKNFISKIFDYEQTWILDEFNIMGDEGNTTVTAYVKSDLESGTGQIGSVSLLADADLLATDTILGTWILGSKDFVFADAGIDTSGRFLQFEVKNATINKSFAIEEIQLIVQGIGLDPMAKQGD